MTGPTEEECLRAMWLVYAHAHADRVLRAAHTGSDNAEQPEQAEVETPQVADSDGPT